MVSWAVGIKDSACPQSCCSRACRGAIEQGQLRVRSAGDLCARRWFHPGCVAGGLGPLEAVLGTGELKPAERDVLREFCDDPAAGRVRAQFVAQARVAKRHKGSPAAEQNPPPEDELEEDQAGGAVREKVANLEWFDSLSYNALQGWVPTAGVVPKGAVHAVAKLKGALLVEEREAKARGDAPGRARAWKAITFIDRLLFGHLPRGKRGRKGDTRAEVVNARVRPAWQRGLGRLVC